ncbi:MAG: alpha/beta hydrolase [Bacteroidota bacterium]
MSSLFQWIAVFFVFFCVCSCEPDVKKKADSITRDHDSIPGLQLAAHDTLNKPYIPGDKLTYEQAYNKALTLFPVPFVEQDIKTRFGNAHVLVSGPETGEPIVLLHGMNASSTMWYPNIKALSEHYRVYAIDNFLEPGKSQYIGQASGIEDVVNWYFEIFDQLQLKKINLVGASRGGWVSVNLALHSPARIKKLILLSPAQTFGILKPGLGIYSDINYSVNPKRKNLRDFLETMSAHVDSMHQIFINQYYLATKKSQIDMNILTMQPFSRRELKKLNMPVCVMIGDMDIINGAMSLRRAERLAKAKTAIISHAGHFVSMDQPADVNSRILDFLKK